MLPRFLWAVPEAWIPNLGVLRPMLQSPLQEAEPLAPTTGDWLPGVAEPWDHLRGAERFRVTRNKGRLDQECINSAIESWGPNCTNF